MVVWTAEIEPNKQTAPLTEVGDARRQSLQGTELNGVHAAPLFVYKIRHDYQERKLHSLQGLQSKHS